MLWLPPPNKQCGEEVENCGCESLWLRIEWVRSSAAQLGELIIFLLSETHREWLAITDRGRVNPGLCFNILRDSSLDFPINHLQIITFVAIIAVTALNLRTDYMVYSMNYPIIFSNFCKKPFFLHFSGHPGNHKTLKRTKTGFKVSHKGSTKV